MRRCYGHRGLVGLLAGLLMTALWCRLAPLAAGQQNGYATITADSLGTPLRSVSGFFGRGFFGNGVALTGTWLFRAGDDPAWADPRLDDSGWLLARTHYDFHAMARATLPVGLPGIGWYRVHLRADSAAASTPLGLAVHRGAATEVYLDGMLVHTTGRVGAVPEQEEPEWTNRISPLRLRAGTTHVLAVRFSNFTSEPVLHDGANAGFFLVLGDREKMRESRVQFTRSVSVHQMLLTGLLLEAYGSSATPPS